MNIREHFGSTRPLKPVDESKKNGTRQEIEKFVSLLHSTLPTIEKEYDWIMSKRVAGNDCKAFEEKANGLAHLAAACDDLYYWYIKQPGLE